MNKISFRIKEIVKLIPPFRRIADVGCDHGYLIKEAFDNDLIDFALGIDNKIGPLTSAMNNLSEYPEDKYSLILSNGIDDLPKDIECVCILGMGGILINEILENSDKRSNVKRFIIQPNKNSYEVRKYLTKIGYLISNETIIYDKKYYEIIVFEKGSKEYTELELKYGPVNLKNKTFEFKNYLKEKIETLNKVKDKEKVSNKIKEMEELLWKLLT